MDIRPLEVRLEQLITYFYDDDFKELPLRYRTTISDEIIELEELYYSLTKTYYYYSPEKD